MGIPKQRIAFNRQIHCISSYRKKVEQILRTYPLIKKRIERENAEKLPSCTTWYEENKVQETMGYSSTTEKYGILRAEQFKEIRPIEDALTVLSKGEREWVRESYFGVDTLSIDEICEKLGYSRRSYFRMKSEVLEKLAFVLGLKDNKA